MNETDEIVSRLRAAGECPKQVRVYVARAVVLQAADEIERLREQRDHARRRYCQSMLEHGEIWRRVDGRNVLCTTHDDVAEIMGWKLP